MLLKVGRVLITSASSERCAVCNAQLWRLVTVAGNPQIIFEGVFLAGLQAGCVIRVLQAVGNTVPVRSKTVRVLCSRNESSPSGIDFCSVGSVS